ncbi:protein serine/threonine phosphatase 2C, partial [Nadsonia fulvescens var. elongata DSM 6958]
FSEEKPVVTKARVPLLKSPSHFGHYTSRVDRPSNEDRYFADGYESQEMKRQVFMYSVFDGHGGEDCSQFLKDHLANYIEECDITKGEEVVQKYERNFGGYWRRWKNQLSKYVSKMSTQDDLQLRLLLAFLNADYDYSASERNVGSGSTCTSVFIYTDSPTHQTYWDLKAVSQLTIAHVGDTRCIISDRFGEARPLTSNHHPSSPFEANRLKRYASSFFTDSFGEERFGVFANTRSFGDLRMKSRGVSAEPDVSQYLIGDTNSSKFPGNTQYAIEGGKNNDIKTLGGDEAFIVIVSDGVSNEASDQEIVDVVVQTANQSGSGRGTPQQAAVEVVRYAEALGGDDNATCLVIRLSGWGKWPKRADRTGELREHRLKNAFDRKSR